MVHDLRNHLKIGTVGKQCFVVEPKHVIDFADREMPAVLCTPWLIWFLEHAAREAVLPSLEADESTVGTEIEVQHFAATPPGQTVVCQARVVRVNGPEVWFQLEAHDESEPVAKGFHKLRIIRKDRFAAHVSKKAGPAMRDTFRK
jgi:fluoroacetyl-CoA thioesterase